MQGKEPLLVPRKDSGLDRGVWQELLPSEEAYSQGGSWENKYFALTLFPSPISYTVFHWPSQTKPIPGKDPIGMNHKDQSSNSKSHSPGLETRSGMLEGVT